MGDHAQGMNPGIGSSGTVQIDFFSGHQGKPLLDLGLDRRLVLLALPAAEPGTVIADDQLDIAKAKRHRPSVSGYSRRLKERAVPR